MQKPPLASVLFISFIFMDLSNLMIEFLIHSIFSMLVFLFHCSYHAFYMLYSSFSLLIRSLFTYFAFFFFQVKNAGLHPN